MYYWSRFMGVLYENRPRVIFIVKNTGRNAEGVRGIYVARQKQSGVVNCEEVPRDNEYKRICT
jgi:hypothetical protein